MKQLIIFILIITSLSLNAQGVKIQPKNCTTPTVDTDIKLLFSVVNDSIRIDSFDNKTGVIVGSPQYLQINKGCEITDTLVFVIDGQSNSIGQQPSSNYPIKELCNLEVWNGTSWVAF